MYLESFEKGCLLVFVSDTEMMVILKGMEMKLDEDGYLSSKSEPLIRHIQENAKALEFANGEGYAVELTKKEASDFVMLLGSAFICAMDENMDLHLQALDDVEESCFATQWNRKRVPFS